MKKTYRLSRIPVLPAAKLFAVLYILLGILIGLVVLVSSMFSGKFLEGVLVAVLAPVGYGALGFVAVAFFCWLYNVLAGIVGAIEWELEEVVPAPPAAPRTQAPAP